MARSKSTSVPAGRFTQAAPAQIARIGSCDLAPGRYVKPRDQYGFHFRRVLADGQYVDYTITTNGMLVEKVNFVPSKDRRDGNGAYGNRWLGILAYRQSDDYVVDLEFAAANGMAMEPTRTAPKGGSSVWTAG